MIEKVLKWLFVIIAVLSIISAVYAPQFSAPLLITNVLFLSLTHIYNEKLVYELTQEKKFDQMWKTKLVIVIAVFGFLAFGLVYTWPGEVVMAVVNILISTLGTNTAQSSEAVKG
jgi:hypothetical protein